MKTTPSPAQPHIAALRTGPRAGVDVASELRRLMPRDRWLLELLDEHHVFTTEQVAALGFDHVHTARNRLTVLQRRGILARFRDGLRPGSQQWRWTLDLVGATYLAARHDRPTPKPAAVRHRINRLATNPNLAHLLGINGFFVALAAHARYHPCTALNTWWSERTCRQVTGELARPDGHGVWSQDDATLGFWLEWDTGTEPMHRVVSKVDGYASLHRATRLDHTVLYWLNTPGREASLQARLVKHPAVTSGALSIATACGDANPAGPIWLPVGQPNRVGLADLAAGGQRIRPA
jgi:protein involved in plasmid replication-relaxation